jgi:hypothetical protein
MKSLEIEVDLALTEEDETKLDEYIRAYGTLAGTRQLAQDLLGHTGAVVQGAELVDA